MNESRAANHDKQRDSFNKLVEEGVYHADFKHGHPLLELVQTIFSELKLAHKPASSLLDAGCGTGTWLEFVGQLPGMENCQLFGFDISDNMVQLTAEKLQQFPLNHFHQGDALDPAAYEFEQKGFDLLFTFDTIQQLPPSKQFATVELMLKQLNPGGRLLLFDHDKDTAYGRSMGRKKFLTQYCFLPLVPRFYCNAKYPPLARFAHKLETQGYLCKTLIGGPNNIKHALIIQAPD